MLLRDAFRERPMPVFLAPDSMVPGATVWTGSRLWVDALRRQGLSADRPAMVAIALRPSVAFLQAVTGSLFEGHHVVFIAPGTRPPAAAALLLCFAEDAPSELALDPSCPSLFAGPGGPPALPDEGLPVGPQSALAPVTREVSAVPAASGPRIRGIDEQGRSWELDDERALEVLSNSVDRIVPSSELHVTAAPWSGAEVWLSEWLPTFGTRASVFVAMAGGHASAYEGLLVGGSS
jgi:hypothetical protein